MKTSVRFGSCRNRNSTAAKERERKLEQQEEKHQDKVLSLDPPHNIYHLYYQNQTQNHQVQGGGGAEEESQNTASHEYQLFQHHHQLESTHPQSQPPAAVEHARLRGNMRETTHHLHQTSSRNSGGEIVQVQGGHVLRSIGRKDRHSKVCTSKGPRDRRVRLAANTAIQFYDVQDRLGYDRPSKAVDWLIKKAKASIDELAHLPPWNPAITSASAPDVNFEQQDAQKQLEENLNRQPHGSSTADLNVNNPSFLPPSMDSDAIEDTIKSFFPMGGSDEASSSDMHFQSFPSSDLLSRTSSQSQDLRLTLQSFQDPILLHHHHHHNNKQPQRYQSPSHHTDQQAHLQAQVLFAETTPLPLGFGNTGWSEHHQQPSWNVSGDSTSGGFLFNLPPAAQPLGQNHFFSQRGPLQSSNTPSFRAWMDPSAITIATSDRSQHYHHHPELESIYTTSISGVGFTPGISGFHFPARIQGDEEEHDGYSDKPSSASSDSRH